MPREPKANAIQPEHNRRPPQHHPSLNRPIPTVNTANHSTFSALPAVPDGIDGDTP
ncbi:hypothetical protein GCM10009090_33670 [[Pseudomonas] boreopolis]|uniref:Uncharacterized protein n=1 Tax=Xanthomonas boreopolis TaxID=86183 RepID=A0A919FAZ8_9XANT|nr:hypothetical protein GCM10009090_33670 [[Pseudomonas] boreopolis]